MLKMKYCLIVLASLTITIFAHHHHYHHHMVPHYHFEYGVHDPHTKDHKSQWEKRDHDEVRGAYTIDEPDGTKRIVEYVAGKHTGFRARVRHIGKSHHPHGGYSHIGESFWGYDAGR